MRIAVLQCPSPSGDVKRAVSEAYMALRAASAAGAGVLVLPEVFLPGYNCADPAAAAPDAALLDELHETALAAGCALVLGHAERDGEAVYNSASVLGTARAGYHKVQLYGPRERALYTPGDAYCTFDLGGLRAALLICYDIEFAPHIKALADQGVQLILCPTANMMPFIHVPAHTVPAMAANHGLAIAYANYCGSEGNLTYTGGSLIAGPHGEVLAQAGQHPALLIADLPPRDPSRLSTQSLDLRTL
jgi:predicted amidohydrolase